MAKLFRSIAVVTLAAAVGAFGGYFAAQRALECAPAVEAETPPVAGTAELDRANATIARQKQEIERMQKLLARAAALVDKSIADDRQSGAAATNATFGVAVGSAEGLDILGELRKNLTEEEFNAATNAISQASIVRAAKAADKIEFLSSLDTDSMEAAEKAVHAKFIERLKRREAVMAKMTGGIPTSDTLQEFVEAEMGLAEVAKEERAALLSLAARELGYSGDAADTLRETMESIFDCTSQSGLEAAMDGAGGMPAGGISIETSVMSL